MEQPYLKLEIPSCFHVAPFYVDNQVLELSSIPDHIAFHTPFFYDLLYLEKPDYQIIWPWIQEDNFFHTFWTSHKDQIRDLFHKRNQEQARGPMIQSVAAFIDQMYWSSGKPVSTLNYKKQIQDMKEMRYAPLNCDERLSYVLNQPDRYLSFIQLDELEQELTKKLAVRRRLQVKDTNE
ncbi:YpoC family protein [Sporolactobacillus laevolacticus]|uniref:YpoC-like domain-containing protein n=1 Tax=Sporolactobacillus laevolacticus DSM 442 TaxID=1395513 RepID=V6J1D0_9BACL|nr:hypothetical protein [Sporolactobacillus laevolacticus]EST10569.1 hypothetical protein P343_16625 [Sporolactobacillus laevolacticus DSM 442]